MITTDDDPVTDKQLTLLAILRQRDYGAGDYGRSAWFDWLASIVGRRLVSNKQMSKAEASAVIDLLVEPKESDAR